MKFLLEWGATPATDPRDDGIPDITYIGPALHVAVHEGHLEIVGLLLLQHGADKNQKNQEGNTALGVAETKGHIHKYWGC
ncbi:hypothetical protein PAAG_11240 [Paracoccidioides lutzii Pb01]|uniref:Uncharacterized protein n=1 Tax=Paracoccidioides lutzii (strain ATCC MYA-826 / Pb01) TaxID=502779 RepID=A0A0A2VMI9_PARBA|nr:hypothetical protein PAAG_11240 [Paracoccidioides lutzii Pb01]KGQ02059.1 hypothetical protein PAAG_11240 [Paracoccidioides lutzii Pb01]